MTFKAINGNAPDYISSGGGGEFTIELLDKLDQYLSHRAKLDAMILWCYNLEFMIYLQT